MIQIIVLSKQSRLLSQGFPSPSWVDVWCDILMSQLASADKVCNCHLAAHWAFCACSLTEGSSWVLQVAQGLHHKVPLGLLISFLLGNPYMPSHPRLLPWDLHLHKYQQQTCNTLFFFFFLLSFLKHPLCRHRRFHQSGLPVHGSGAGHDAERALCQIR